MAVDPNFNWVRSLVQGNSTENLAGTKWPTTVTGSTAGTDYLGLANGDLTVSNTEFAASDWDTRASPYRKQVRYQMVIEGTSPWVVGARVATGYDYTISNSASAGVLEVRTYQSSSSVATFQVPTSGAYTIEINESALPGGGNTGRVDIYYVVYVNRSEFQTGASAAFGLWDVGAAKYSSLSPYIKVGGASAANTLINSSEFTVVANIVVPGYRSAANAVLAKIPLHSEARSRTTTVSGSMPSVFTESVVLSGSKTWRIGAGTPTHPYFTATVNLAGMTETQGATVAAQSLAAQVAAAYPGLKVGGGAVRPYSDTYSFTQSGVAHSATTYWDNYYVDVPELSLTTPWPDPTVSATEIAYASGGVAGAFTDSPIGRYVENGQYGSGAGQLAVITFTFAGAPHADNGVAIRPISGNTYTSVIAEVSSPTDAANFVANYIATEATSSIVTLGNSSTVTLTSRLPVNINQEMASVVAAGRRVPVVSGISKLYGFRATVQAEALLPPVDLPWPTTSIPPGGGGGGGGGGALPADVWLALGFENGSATDLSTYAHTKLVQDFVTLPTTGSRTSDGYAEVANGATVLNYAADLDELNGLAGLTIEFDFYIPTNSQYGYFFGPTGSVYMTADTTAGNGTVTIVTNGWIDPLNNQSFTFSAGAWHHIAIVGGATNCRFFVDGVVVGASGYGMSATNFSPSIGAVTTLGVLNISSRADLAVCAGMRLDNVLITKREKYTANFTPPGAITGGGSQAYQYYHLANFDFPGTYTQLWLSELQFWESSSVRATGTAWHTTVGTNQGWPPSDGILEDGDLTSSSTSGWSLDFTSYPGTGINPDFALNYDLGVEKLATGFKYAIPSGSAGPGLAGVAFDVYGSNSAGDWSGFPAGQTTWALINRVTVASDPAPGVLSDFVEFYSVPPSSADVTGAGYNDIEELTSFGTGNTQATDPDSYGISATDLDDFTVNIVAYIDAADITGTGTTTLAAFTNTGAGVAAIPTDLTGDPIGQLDDFTSAADGVADMPLEFTADYTLDDFTGIAVGLFLAPVDGGGDALLDDFFIEDFTASTITPPTAQATFSLPMLKVAASGSPAQFSGALVTLPEFTLTAQGGHYSTFSLPRITVEATGTTIAMARAIMTVPMVEVEATGRVAGQSSVQTRLPRIEVSSFGGHQAEITLPEITATATATVGSAAQAELSLPRITVTAHGYRDDTARADITLPMLVMTPSAVAEITLPAFTVLAHGQPVLTNAYEAYVLNMNQPLDDNPRNNFEAKVEQVTRYTNWPFIQVVRLGSTYYGVAEDGLYELGGTTDNGTEITWSFETCKTDFDDPHKKAVASAYIGGQAGATVDYTLRSGDDVDHMYGYVTTKVIQKRNHRQKFGLGRRVRYYSFGLAGSGKAAIDMLEFELLNTTRRI